MDRKGFGRNLKCYFTLWTRESVPQSIESTLLVRKHSSLTLQLNRCNSKDKPLGCLEWQGFQHKDSPSIKPARLPLFAVNPRFRVEWREPVHLQERPQKFLIGLKNQNPLHRKKRRKARPKIFRRPTELWQCASFKSHSSNWPGLQVAASYNKLS